MFNLNFSIDPISDEKVDNPRALFFGVSSDLLSGNENSLILFGFNIAALLTIKFLFKLVLNEDSFINQLFKREMKFMIYGQIISLIQQLILPWKYIL